jgi:hypothetical protein
MAKPGTPRRRPDAPSVTPTTLTEIARRYYACAIALAKAMGVPLTETFLREHWESISCCFIEAGRAGVRLRPAVQLPPLIAPKVETPAEAGEIMCSGMPSTPEAPATNGHPPLVAIPTDAGLPCAGQAIHTLKPAQLAMLVSKVARLVQDQGGRWVPLLHALQAERAGRLDRGQRRTVALVPPAEADGPDVPPTTVTTTGEG